MENVLLLGMGTGALLVRVGLGFYMTGLSRSKNSAAALTRTLCDFCFVVLAFWAVGAAILWQVSNAVFGVNPHHILARASMHPSFS